MIMKLLLLLTLATVCLSQPLTKSLSFKGNYTLYGKSSTYSVSVSPYHGIVNGPSVGNSVLAFDDTNKRIYWDIGSGGRTYFFEDAVYGILDSVAPGVCFLVTKKDGSNYTYYDEVKGYSTLRNTRNVTVSDNIKIVTKFLNVTLPGSLNEVYHGLADDAQRCKYPYTAEIFLTRDVLNVGYKFITGVSVNQLFDVPTPPNSPFRYLTLNSYSTIIYDTYIPGVPSNSLFQLPDSCLHPVDWCSTFGGY